LTKAAGATERIAHVALRRPRLIDVVMRPALRLGAGAAHFPRILRLPTIAAAAPYGRVRKAWTAMAAAAADSRLGSGQG